MQTASPRPPGYSRITPILLGLASLALFFSAFAQLDRNLGFTSPEPGTDRGHVRGYVDNVHAAEGQVLEFDLGPSQPGSRPVVLTTRDDRPWRTFAPGEEVRLLRRVTVTARGYVNTEYIIDDFAAKWGGVIARGAAAVLCDIGAIVALLLGRRRPSAARHFPPPLPRPGVR